MTNIADPPDPSADETPAAWQPSTEELTERLRTLIPRFPNAAPVVAVMLDQLEMLEANDEADDAVMEIYNFVRAHPDLALIMTALSQISGIAESREAYIAMKVAEAIKANEADETDETDDGEPWDDAPTMPRHRGRGKADEADEPH